MLVSVLDLDSLMLRDLAITDLPPLGDVSMTLICFSLNDVKYDLTIACVQQDDQIHALFSVLPPKGLLEHEMNLMIMSDGGVRLPCCLAPNPKTNSQDRFGKLRAHDLMVEPRRIELLTS